MENWTWVRSYAAAQGVSCLAHLLIQQKQLHDMQGLVAQAGAPIQPAHPQVAVERFDQALAGSTNKAIDSVLLLREYLFQYRVPHKRAGRDLTGLNTFMHSPTTFANLSGAAAYSEMALMQIACTLDDEFNVQSWPRSNALMPDVFSQSPAQPGSNKAWVVLGIKPAVGAVGPGFLILTPQPKRCSTRLAPWHLRSATILHIEVISKMACNIDLVLQVFEPKMLSNLGVNADVQLTAATLISSRSRAFKSGLLGAMHKLVLSSVQGHSKMYRNRSNSGHVNSHGRIPPPKHI